MGAGVALEEEVDDDVTGEGGQMPPASKKTFVLVGSETKLPSTTVLYRMQNWEVELEMAKLRQPAVVEQKALQPAKVTRSASV